MPYLGNVPAEAYTNTVKDSFNGDGSTTAFTLSQPSTTNNLRVVVENVIQDPTVAYTVSGTTLTFTSAPPTGTANIYAVHLGPATQTAVPPAEITSATNFTDGITVDKDGGTVITADRASSDGTIIDLQKSGTTVGNIGTYASSVYIGTPDRSNIVFGTNAIVPANNTGGNRNNAIDLGESGVSFKDLYLGGGVYFGGTGSANKLDDYEEGTWTPILAYVLGGTREYTPSSANVGRYTKIGNAVYITATVAWSGNNGGSTSSYVAVKGLPFTTTSTSDLRMSGSMGGTAGLTMPSGYTNGFAIGADPNNSHVYVMARSTSAYSHSPLISASGALYGFSMTYLTDA